MSGTEHEYEHRCCWNCGADNSHITAEETLPFDPQGFAGMFQAIVICHESRCPDAGKYGDYADPPLKEWDWHPIALRCPAWVSADGILPSTHIEAKG